MIYKPCPKLSDVDISISSSFHGHFSSLSAICLSLSLQCWHSQSAELSCSDDKFASGQLCSSLAQPVPVHTGPASPLAKTQLQQKHLHFTNFSIWNEVLPLSFAHTPLHCSPFVASTSQVHVFFPGRVRLNVILYRNQSEAPLSSEPSAANLGTCCHSPSASDKIPAPTSAPRRTLWAAESSFRGEAFSLDILRQHKSGVNSFRPSIVQIVC